MLERPSDDLMLTYQVTAGQRPVVVPRDFLFLTSTQRIGSTFIAGGCSAEHKEYPVTSNRVRAWQFPTCMTVAPVTEDSSMFTWLLQCDFGGLLPLSILNAVMPYAIGLFISSLRKEVQRVKKGHEIPA